jgi:hypothetical protein
MDNIMKVEFLHLDTTIKPSIISESVVEIQTNLHLARKNVTTQHPHGHEDPACGHSLWQLSKSWAGSYLTLVHVFHVIPRWASVGDPYTILMYNLEL